MSSLADRLRRVRWLTVPIGAYLLITLVLPFANGAASRGDFSRHAAWVVASCVALLGICVAGGALSDVVRSTVWRKR